MNWKPAGAFRINVTFVPRAKSEVDPSVIVMVPNVVQAGDGAFAAVSAEILAFARVILTVARARPAPARANPTPSTSTTTVFRPRFLVCMPISLNAPRSFSRTRAGNSTQPITGRRSGKLRSGVEAAEGRAAIRKLKRA